MVGVFRSHSSKDKPFVRDLAAALEAGGEVKVWLDEREIDYGRTCSSPPGHRREGRHRRRDVGHVLRMVGMLLRRSLTDAAPERVTGQLPAVQYGIFS
jgi:hypothetical protein